VLNLEAGAALAYSELQHEYGARGAVGWQAVGRRSRSARGARSLAGRCAAGGQVGYAKGVQIDRTAPSTRSPA